MDWLPPWSLLQEMLLRLVLPAFASAFVLCALVCVLTRSRCLRMLGGAVAVAAGIYAGNHYRELLTWWPADPAALAAAGDDPALVPWWQVERGWAALLPATVTALLGGAIAALVARRTHPGIGLALRLMLAALGALWLTENFPPLSLLSTTLVMFAGMALNWEALRRAESRQKDRLLPFILILGWGVAASTVLIFAHSARFSDLGVLLTMSLTGAVAAAALWKQEITEVHAAPAVFIPGLMLAGVNNTYSMVPPEAFALLAFAPCALWLPLLLPRKYRWQERAWTALAAVVFLLPCFLAVMLAMKNETLDFSE